MKYLTWQLLAGTALVQDEALQSRWNQLCASRIDLPFMRAEALAVALSVFGDGQQRLLVASQDGEDVAMFVLEPDGTMIWRSFQPSQMPLGPWVARPDQNLQDLCRSMMRGPLRPCLALSISQIDPLLAERHSDAPDNRHGDYIETASLDVSGSFDDYWALRGKNLRQNMRKQRNKLEAQGTKTTLRVLRDPRDMAAAVARYGALESAGWKADQGTAVHPDNPQGRFYVQLLEGAARRQEALVFEYLMGDITAAINLCLHRSGILVVLKTTYNESIDKSLSPASLLREDELKFIFGGGDIRRIEYFGRRMEWHTKLTDQSRVLYHLTSYRWPWLKAIAARRRAGRLSSAAGPVTSPAPTSEPPAQAQALEPTPAPRTS